MATFKIKGDKAKTAIQINTLDEIHRKYIDLFQKRKKLLPKKKKRILDLKAQLNGLEKIDPKTFTLDQIQLKSKLKTDIETLENDVYDIENDISEMEYYCKTEDIIMDYYDIMDHDDHKLYETNPELSKEKENTDADNEPDHLDILNNLNKNKRKVKKATKRRRRKTQVQTNTDILSYFSGKPVVNKEEKFEEITKENIAENNIVEFKDDENTLNHSESSNSSNEQPKNKEQNNEKAKNKAELLDIFMMLVDSDYMCDKKKVSNGYKKCSNCNLDKTLMHSEGFLVCQSCGEIEMIIIDSEKPNFKEAVNDTKPGYPYKRINHFNESRRARRLQYIHFRKIMVLMVFRHLKINVYTILWN